MELLQLMIGGRQGVELMMDDAPVATLATVPCTITGFPPRTLLLSRETRLPKVLLA